MVPLATIGKIFNGTIGRIPKARTIGLTNGTIGTTNGTISTNVSTNGNIDTNGTIGCREMFRVLWLPMVPLATNGTIGKFSNGTIGRIPNARHIHSSTVSPEKDKSLTPAPNLRRTRASHDSQYNRYIAYSDHALKKYFP